MEMTSNDELTTIDDRDEIKYTSVSNPRRVRI